MVIVRTRGVVKKFGEITAVAGVDLDIESGECFGLLGPNGAGKTTLVRMISAVSPLTSGEIRVADMDVTKNPREVKALMATVPQQENLDPDLTVWQNLVTFARYYDIPKDEARKRAKANLELFELSHREKAKIEQLSGGMKRRLLLARGLLNQPKIILLDEPSVGLDPQTKHVVWQKLRTLKEQGVTLLLCTQNMEEAERLCDRLAIINEGKVIALGTPTELVMKHGGGEILEARPPTGKREQVLSLLKQRGLPWEELLNTIYVFTGDGAGLGEIFEQEIGVIGRRKPTLEDVFLRLTGRALIET